MSKAIYLIFLTLLASAYWILSLQFLDEYLLMIKEIKSSQLTAVLIIFAIALYLIFGGSDSKAKGFNEVYYAKKITVEEYEMQKRSYTQLKLAELYSDKEYQEHIKRKMLQPRSHIIQENEFSSEDD